MWETDELHQTARVQLNVLQLLSQMLANLHIRFWLRGGWAIDFMLGRVTRQHSDIDIVVWAKHRSRVRRALVAAEFRIAQDTETQTDFQVSGQVLSISYLRRTPDGSVITHGIPSWHWPDGSLSVATYALEGLTARTVGPRQLLWEKESYEAGTGRPPRPKDLKSMEVLRAMIAQDGRLA